MRRGFTLVEMLVATALVMLIMLLFARIFEEAISTVRAQRSIIANDEKARAVSQILRSDLDRAVYRTSVGRGATNRIPLPLLPGNDTPVESPPGIVTLAPGDRVDPRQRGFIYISENDPRDDGDDVLHLIVSIGETLRDPLTSNPDYAPYQGRAGSANIIGTGNLNQPDFDDGIANSASTSRAAELCYFLRGTTLFRRVQLIRDPLPAASPFGTQPSVGATGTGGPLLATIPNIGLPNALHYRDFDFAATNLNGELHFHGLESLDNSLGLSNSPLAVPGFRFGFAPGNAPREFDALGNYFGRFTQGETSHEIANGLGVNGFRWPGVDDGNNNRIVDSALIMSPGAVVAVDADASATFNAGDVPLQGSRVGEDILMTGVESFNIEFWDPGFAEFDEDASGGPPNGAEDLNGNGQFDQGIWVDLGNNFQRGLWTEQWNAPSGLRGNNTWGRQNNSYGPPNSPTGNHVFDTWHPSLGASLPYRPLQVVPNALQWTDFVPTGATAVTAGTVFFPKDSFQSTSSNGSFGYVALSAGNVGTRQPEWSREPGTTVRDNQVLWQCFDNRIGLEKIRITIRFRDPGTGQPRQVTVLHSFVE